jgi:surface protein
MDFDIYDDYEAYTDIFDACLDMPDDRDGRCSSYGGLQSALEACGMIGDYGTDDINDDTPEYTGYYYSYGDHDDTKLDDVSSELQSKVKEWFVDKRSAMKKYGHISDWDVSKVVSFKGLFSPLRTYTFGDNIGASMKFNSDLSKWNTSSATDMSDMFSYAKNFSSDLSGWDVSSVVDMSGMFSFAEKFNSDLSVWGVFKVEDMSSMFLQSSSFNQDISSWRPQPRVATADMFKNSGTNNCFWDVPALHEDRVSIGRFYCNAEPHLKDGEKCTLPTHQTNESETCDTSASMCKSRCCTHNTPSACQACGLDGTCFAPPTTNITNWNPFSLNASVGFHLKLTVHTFNRIAWNDMIHFTAEGMLVKDGHPLQTDTPITFQLKWLPQNSSTNQNLIVGGNPPPDYEWDTDEKGPGGIGIDSQTGEIFAAPNVIGNDYTAWLIAVNNNGPAAKQGLPTELDQVLLKEWTFEVNDPDAFVVDDWEWNTAGIASINVTEYVYERKPDGPDVETSAKIYGVGGTYQFPMITLSKVRFAGLGHIMFTMDGAPDGFLIDPTNGYIKGTPAKAGNGIQSLKIFAVNGAGAQTMKPLVTIRLDVRKGPSGEYCSNNGKIVDDGGTSFTCDCEQTATLNAEEGFDGTNCKVDIAKRKAEDTAQAKTEEAAKAQAAADAAEALRAAQALRAAAAEATSANKTATAALAVASAAQAQATAAAALADVEKEKASTAEAEAARAQAETAAAQALAATSAAEAATAASKAAAKIQELEATQAAAEAASKAEQDATVAATQNEQEKAAAASQNEADKKQTSFTTGLAAGGIIILILLIIAAVAYRQHRFSMQPVDFNSIFNKLVESGDILIRSQSNRASFEQTINLPREIPRRCIAKSEKIGEGAFGEVFKGILDETSNNGVPGYPVACKSVADATGDGADDLLQEATVMAQIGHHVNLVSLIGVITSGVPLLIIIALCEHGSLKSQLEKRVLGEGKLVAKPGALAPKIDADIGLDIAQGMQHLVKHHLVHRDLAARNVLLNSQLVAKVADFGLSRAFSAEEGKDYYKSTAGMMALRWTAPEAMTTLKFSMKTDVWSFGIVLLEIATDGDLPIKELTNAEIMAKMQSGYQTPQPDGCSDGMFAVMCRCWALDPAARPSFLELVDLFREDDFESDAHTPNTMVSDGANGAVVSADRDATGVNVGAGAGAGVNNGHSTILTDYQAATPYTATIYQRVVVEEAEVATLQSPLAGLAATPLVELREAIAAAEAHTTCSSGLSTELEVALVFATRKVTNGRSQGLTIDQVAAINLYTQESSFYLGLNGAFGGWGEGGGHAAVPHYLPYMKILFGAFEALPKAPNTVFRGIRGKSLATLLQGKGVGEELVWQAPTSTTGTSDVLRDPTFFGFGAEHGARVVFVIEMQSGVRIKSFSALGSIIEYYLQPFGSTEQDEDEYLLPPGTTFVIDAIDAFSNDVTQVKMHEVAVWSAADIEASNDVVSIDGVPLIGEATIDYASNHPVATEETITASGYVVKGSTCTNAAGLYAALTEETSFNSVGETAFGSTLTVHPAVDMITSNYAQGFVAMNGAGSFEWHLDTFDPVPSVAETGATTEHVRSFITKLERDIDGVHDIVEMLTETAPPPIRTAVAAQAKLETGLVSGNHWLSPSKLTSPRSLMHVKGVAQTPAAAYEGRNEPIPVQRTASDEFVRSMMALKTQSTTGNGPPSDFAEPEHGIGYLTLASNRVDQFVSDLSQLTTRAANSDYMSPQVQAYEFATATPHYPSGLNNMRKSNFDDSGPFRQITEC